MSGRFPRSARLKRRRLIRPLFDRASSGTISFGAGCIRVLVRRVSGGEAGQGGPLRAGFAVPRKTGNAVRRNRIRRIMRETWRLERRECAGQEVVTAMFLLRNANAADADVRRDMKTATLRLEARLTGTLEFASEAPGRNPLLDTQSRG